jgi:hypothetical protein
MKAIIFKAPYQSFEAKVESSGSMYQTNGSLTGIRATYLWYFRRVY